MVMLLTHCVAIFVGVFAQDFHTLKLRLVMVRVCLRLWANSSITIGNHVKIGGDCILLDSDAHSLDYHMRRVEERIATPKYMSAVKTAPIVIEDDVLIGTRCIILKGVTIGARSVIGSGSVVTKSIPPDCIAAGNPCKVVKSID